MCPAAQAVGVLAVDAVTVGHQPAGAVVANAAPEDLLGAPTDKEDRRGGGGEDPEPQPLPSLEMGRRVTEAFLRRGRLGRELGVERRAGVARFVNGLLDRAIGQGQPEQFQGELPAQAHRQAHAQVQPDQQRGQRWADQAPLREGDALPVARGGGRPVGLGAGDMAAGAGGLVPAMLAIDKPQPRFARIAELQVGALVGGVAHAPLGRDGVAATPTGGRTVVHGARDREDLGAGMARRAWLLAGWARGLILTFACPSGRGPLFRWLGCLAALGCGMCLSVRWVALGRPGIATARWTGAVVGVLIESLAGFLQVIHQPQHQRLDRLGTLHHQAMYTLGVELAEVVVGDLHRNERVAGVRVD